MNQRAKANQINLRRFAISPRNRVLSTPKFDIQKIATEQEQRVRNYLYKKSNILGKGYSSKVYKAHKADELYKPYAIKVIDLSQLNYEQRKNLELELKVQKNLSHPNIVKCYQTFKTVSAYYLILEYCQHGTLSDYLKSHKKLDQSSVINIISQIFQAYEHLIDLKILHRDLKPQNILRRDNSWKITDFGFCCNLEGQFYKDDMNVGTPLYMPPESLTKDVYSVKSDIYSLGIMTYKLLTGSTPWKCSTERQLIYLMSTQKVLFPVLKNRYLDQFLRKSLELDSQKRLNSEQFKQIFKQIKQQQIEIQKNSYIYGDLKKYESSGSITTAESLTVSKKQILKIKQNSFNSSYSTQSNPQSNENIGFMENQKIITEQLEICKIIHHILLNIDSFIVEDIKSPQSVYELSCNTKQVLITFFYKFVLKKVRTLYNYFTTNLYDSQLEQIKYLGIKNFSQFKRSKSFIDITQLIRQKLEFYEAQFLQSYIKKSILTIRFINKKFPELGQNNVPLTKKFYRNILEFIKPFIQQLNGYILQNLQRTKSINKHLKKDRILALSFWMRLYLEFLKKQKFLSQIQLLKGEENNDGNNQSSNDQNNKNKKERNEENRSGKQSNLLLKSKKTINQLQKLKQLKQSIKIEYLYNFKETNLEYKYYLHLRKKLCELLEINFSE